MKRAILRKLLSSILVVFVLTIVIFLIVRLLPGDPVTVMLGMNPTPEAKEALIRRFNFDKPLVTQYWMWLKGILHGDWGNSMKAIGADPVINHVLERFPRSFVLCITATLFSLVVAIPLGVITAAKQNTRADFIISSASLLVVSLPEFWIGMLLLLLFAVKLRILPTSGYTDPSVDFVAFIKSIIMPTLALGLATAPATLRQIRSSMIDVLDEDYIMLSRTKGCSPGRVNFVHALRNSLIPIATTVTMQIASLMAGVVIIENVFTYPGLGQYLLSSIQHRDYPAIQCSIFFFSIVVVASNLLCDIILTFIDPRIRIDSK